MKNYKQIFLLYLTFVQIISVGYAVETSYLEDMSLGCTADLSNYYFNLKGLTRELDL